MDDRDFTAFRVAKYFEEHVPKLLESLTNDPEGMYQIVYRVGELMVSAHVWREPDYPKAETEFSESDREFLRKCKVNPDQQSSDAVR